MKRGTEVAGKEMTPGNVEPSPARVKYACLVCGDPACDHRCNPIAAAGWDALWSALRKAIAKREAEAEASKGA